MFFSLGFSDVLLIVRLGLWILAKEYHSGKVPLSSHNIKGTCYQRGSPLSMLNQGEGLSDFAAVEVSVFPALCTVLFGRKSLGTAHSCRVGGYISS